MQQAEGNPLQIEIKRYGNLNAFMIVHWPDFWYGNKVLGLEPSSEIYLSEIIDLFAKHNLNFRFEIMPGNLNSSLASRLHKLRFAQMGFNTAVYGQPLTGSETMPKNKSKSGKCNRMRSIFFWIFTRMVLDCPGSRRKKKRLFYRGYREQNQVYIFASPMSMICQQVWAFSTWKMGLGCWQMPPRCLSFAGEAVTPP